MNPMRNHIYWDTVETEHTLEDKLGCFLGRGNLGQWHKMGKFAEPVHHREYHNVTTG